MNTKKEMAAKLLKESMDYDPLTGCLAWKSDSGKCNKAVYEKCHDGYLRVGISYGGALHRFMAHRLAWYIHYGKHPSGEVDHINGNRLDNRISNLRDVDRSTNCRNAAKRSDNTSGVSGVYWDKVIGAWRATVRADGARHYVGVFHDLSVAEKAVSDFRMVRGFSARHGT